MVKIICNSKMCSDLAPAAASMKLSAKLTLDEASMASTCCLTNTVRKFQDDNCSRLPYLPI